MTPLSRRPLFWALLSALAVAGGGFALRYFAEAFPLLSVDLQMSRREALEAAAGLAGSAGWEPAGFSQAASFRQSDPEVQTFVELEGGGPAVFAALVEQGPYRPYVWEVRHFAEGEVAETRIRFTPEGVPYGFRRTLAEETPRPGLSPEDARALAETEAVVRWGVDLAAYDPLEASQEVRPGGRTDHTFVYQRVGPPELGSGAVRLRMVVAGDALGELTHFVHVPEAFLRRYQEIRSGNESLALLSNVIFLVGFLVLGCGLGTFFLLRHGWIVWRPALAWAVAIAALLGLGSLNQLPLAWMSYDTAVPRGTFLLQQVGLAAVLVVFGGALLAFVFLAAESLTRRAFPRQPQQWRLWSRGVANSDAVLGRTAGAYLLTGVDLGYVVGFYLLASRLPGWWIPSEALVDPDLLSTPFPWLMALSLSLFAAFWEESLFRAVPIAGAKLLGDRFGGTRLWIATAVILQALVFAAAHANYPQQPAYARVAELFLPALLWGLLYLWFGLLPVILIHFLHNFAFFSVVLFAAADPGLWVDRLIVVALMLAPLAVVLVARARWGRVRELPDALRNALWRPPLVQAPVPAGEAEGTGTLRGVTPGAPRAAGLRAGPPAVRWLVAAGLLGVVLWGAFVDVWPDAPPLDVSREQAVAVARSALEAHGVETGSWEALAGVAGAPGPSARFVWQTAGEDAYRDLLGSYLPPPLWRVRFVRFTGPVEERAEEWRVAVGPGGEVLEVTHRLPEARDGAALEEAQARALAERTLGERLDAAPAALREVSAEARQRPARRDWTFTYAVPDAAPLGDGEARIQVDVAGDEVVGARRLVHVPESWEREERGRRTRALMVSLGSAGVLVLLLLAAAVTAVVTWSRGTFAPAAAVAVALAVAGVQTVGAANGFPAAFAGFTTAEPLRTQWLTFGVGMLVAVLVVSGALGLLAGLAHTWTLRASWVRPAQAAAAGLAGGLALAGVIAAGAALAPPAPGPDWPGFGAAAAYFPVLQATLDPALGWVTASALLLLLAGSLDRFTAGWTRSRASAAATVLVLGLLVYGSGFEVREGLVQDLARWAAGGLLAAAALGFVCFLAGRVHPAVIPVLAATVVGVGQLRTLLVQPYPGSASGALLSLLLLGAAAFLWTRGMLPRGDPPPAQ